jgi:hypothetical protein
VRVEHHALERAGQRQRGAQQQGGAGNGVTGLRARAAQQAEQQRGKPADQQALPDEVEQRLAACRTWARRLQKYLGRSIFRRFLGQ